MATAYSSRWKATDESPNPEFAKAPEKDYYSILGIEATSTAEEIKAAYRAMAKKHHPDVRTSEGDHQPDLDRFRDILEAYQVLSVRESRISYDLSRKQHIYKFTEVETDYQEYMNIQKGKRDRTGHMPVEAPAKGTFAA